MGEGVRMLGQRFAYLCLPTQIMDAFVSRRKTRLAAAAAHLIGVIRRSATIALAESAVADVISAIKLMVAQITAAKSRKRRGVVVISIDA